MPFTFNMFYFCDPDGHSQYVQDQNPRPVDEKTPEIGTVRAENITCSGVDACVLVAYGLPEKYIGEIIIRNIKASFLPKEDRVPQQTIMMDNFEKMTGRSVYARNVKHLVLENVEIEGSEETGPEIIDVPYFDSMNVYINTRPMRDRACAEQYNRRADEMLQKYIPLADDIVSQVEKELKAQ